MTFRRLLPTLLFASLIAGWLVAVLLVFGALRRDTDEQFARIDAAQQLGTAMLDRELGVRGFLSTLDDADLEPYSEARHRFDDLIERELRAADDGETRAALMRLQVAADKWQELAADDLRALTIDERRFSDELRAREGPIDAFNAEHARYQELLQRQRQDHADALVRRAVVLIVAISLLVGGLALLALRRSTLRERRYSRAQAELASALQSAADESEADNLLKRHLERQLGGDATVTVLRRNGVGDGLRAGTPPRPDSTLAQALEGRSRECLAVRRGGTHAQGAEEPLVLCDLCGRSGPATCRPLLVGDGVIGSVLIEDPAGTADDERVVADSLAQAAPILSGLRTLALAQSRATTDALTGLPNRWALQDALKRMLAQATRSHRPLALVLLDVDHFKRLNDAHGHDAGDRALVAVGEALRGALRQSDLAARSGGEEFSVLLPDTPLEGAVAVAEQLRRAIAEAELEIPEASLTASFGVAVLGIHAATAETLVQVADRALYAAKRGGRDRVEVADSPIQSSGLATPAGAPAPAVG